MAGSDQCAPLMLEEAEVEEVKGLVPVHRGGTHQAYCKKLTLPPREYVKDPYSISFSFKQTQNYYFLTVSMLSQLPAVCPCLSFHLGLIDLLAFPTTSSLLAPCQHPVPGAGSGNSRVCFAGRGCFFLPSFQMWGDEYFKWQRLKGVHQSLQKAQQQGARPALVKLCMYKGENYTLKELKAKVCSSLGWKDQHSLTLS